MEAHSLEERTNEAWTVVAIYDVDFKTDKIHLS